jgi:UDP-glucose 4-epimerase
VRVAVTGSEGFIGRHLVAGLRDHRHEVVAVDTRATPPVDILDRGQLLDHLHGVDVIAHLAAEAYAERAAEHPVNSVRLNVEGTVNVLGVARELGARFFYASTIWVYGSARDGSRKYREDDPLLVTADRHIYTSSKLAGELLTRDYVSMHGLQATILRFGIPYGPGMREEAVLPRFCRAILRGEPIELADGGRQGRQFIHVRDLVDGQLAAFEAAEPGPIYNLVSEEFVQISELAEIVMSVAGIRVPVVHRDGRRGDFSPQRLVSSTRARRELGWRAAVPLVEGVRQYWQWFRSTRGSPQAAPAQNAPLAVPRDGRGRNGEADRSSQLSGGRVVT